MKILDQIRQVVNAFHNDYFIEIACVDIPKDGAIPELIEKQFLILKSDTSIDYTKDLKAASCFSFTLGAIIVNRLKKDSTTASLQYNLVSVADEAFINDVTGGPKAANINDAKTELEKAILNIPGVNGIGVIQETSSDKPDKAKEHIEVSVLSPEVQNKIETTFIKKGSYMGYPVQVKVQPRTQAL